MRRRDFLGALGFTILVPKFGPIFPQGSGMLHTPESGLWAKTILLAQGETYEHAVARFAERMQRFHRAMGSSGFEVRHRAHTFAPTEKRGVFKLQAPPDLGAYRVRGTIVLPGWDRGHHGKHDLPTTLGKRVTG